MREESRWWRVSLLAFLLIAGLGLILGLPVGLPVGLHLGLSRGLNASSSSSEAAGFRTRGQGVMLVEVKAGKFDRRETVVSFKSANLEPGRYLLREDVDKFIPLEVDSERRATFILPELKAGGARRYRLVKATESKSSDGLSIKREGGRLEIAHAGKRVLGFQADQGYLPEGAKPIFRRGGYIHPVYSPSGAIISDDYPPNHWHHHGIWFAWTKTQFEDRAPDFWNMGDATGTVEFVALDASWSGPVTAGFKSRNRYLDLSAKPEAKVALNEVWEVIAYAVGRGELPYSMFDLTSTQETATSSPLILPEYRYGGMGFRGHRAWDGKDNAFFLTSEGKDRSNGHATRARWCHIGGRINGKLYGIAILDHPSNFRAPQPMRIHPTEPFFNYAPSQMGEWRIKPGEPYISRYRYVVIDGPPDKNEIDRFWNDYADPPQVSIITQ